MKKVTENVWLFLVAGTLAVLPLRGSGAESDQPEIDISKLPPPIERKVAFGKDVYPILKESCLICHGPDRQKGNGFRVDKKEIFFRKRLEDGSTDEIERPVVVRGKSEKSSVIHMVAGLIEDLRMPPESDKPQVPDPLKKEQIAILRAWIDQGAEWPEGPIPEVAEKVDFAKQIQPMLQGCITCHGPEKQAGELRLDTREGAIKGGWIYGQTIIPGDSDASPIVFITQGQDTQIPHLEKHKLSDENVELLKQWIDQGAPWGNGE